MIRATLPGYSQPTPEGILTGEGFDSGLLIAQAFWEGTYVHPEIMMLRHRAYDHSCIEGNVRSMELTFPAFHGKGYVSKTFTWDSGRRLNSVEFRTMDDKERSGKDTVPGLRWTENYTYSGDTVKKNTSIHDNNRFIESEVRYIYGAEQLYPVLVVSKKQKRTESYHITYEHSDVSGIYRDGKLILKDRSGPARLPGDLWISKPVMAGSVFEDVRKITATEIIQHATTYYDSISGTQRCVLRFPQGIILVRSNAGDDFANLTYLRFDDDRKVILSRSVSYMHGEFEYNKVEREQQLSCERIFWKRSFISPESTATNTGSIIRKGRKRFITTGKPTVHFSVKTSKW